MLFRSATLEIPGATNGFPAVTLTLPNEIAAFAFQPSTDVTKDSNFTWTGPKTSAFLAFSAFSISGENTVAVSCTLKDDGDFSFSAVTKAEMDSKGFVTAIAPSLTKYNIAFKAQGDTLMTILSTRSATSPQ